MVSIEAIKNSRTTAQIAKDFDVHPVQVSDWKKQIFENTVESFSCGKKKKTEEQLSAEKERLHTKIGQQAIEINFLRKKSKQLPTGIN